MIIEQNIKYTLQYTIKKRKAKIHYLGVERKYQNQGIGRKVFSNLINKLEKKKIEKIEIDAYFESIGFWDKFNFMISEQPQVINGYAQDFHDGYLII